MNYVLALFLPPLSILIAGRPVVALVVFLIWVPAILVSGGLTHPMFVVLAWLLVFQAGEERRARRGRD
jgi:sorbitol-specific phosphotransferase system component IIBC